jgi:3-dehydroquinate dehydratase / shikimate dehydrogenase
MLKNQGKICAVITESTVEAARKAIRRAATEADILEVRLDYLTDFDFTQIDKLGYLLESNSLPVILTCRDYDEGGQQKIENSIRLPLLIGGARQYADYCDIEAAHYEEATKLDPDLSKLIVSYHNFEETPADLYEVYERLSSLPAAIHKLATRANTLADTLPIFHLLQRAEAAGRLLIAIAMNEAGSITRLLGPACGSFLTYGALTDGKPSAPGQYSCLELKELYRSNQLTAKTQVTGIIGNPIGHSVSPAMHNTAFAALELDFVYLPIFVHDVEEFFRRFVNQRTRELGWQLRGFSITIPHKVAVMALLDSIDETAEKIGAVNTVVLEGEKITGYNTDARGAILPLKRVNEIQGKACAVIGAGGAARAVIAGLLEAQASVSVFARDVQKARQLVDDFSIELLPIEKLGNQSADILINTTPIGMHGHSESQSVIEQSRLDKFPIVYDLVYNPLDTRLLREAREAGCITISGLDMLIEQARLQFELWTGQTPSAELMRRAAMKKLRPTDSE